MESREVGKIKTVKKHRNKKRERAEGMENNGESESRYSLLSELSMGSNSHSEGEALSKQPRLYSPHHQKSRLDKQTKRETEERMRDCY